jgi:hypothetical protein
LLPVLAIPNETKKIEQESSGSFLGDLASLMPKWKEEKLKNGREPRRRDDSSKSRSRSPRDRRRRSRSADRDRNRRRDRSGSRERQALNLLFGSNFMFRKRGRYSRSPQGNGDRRKKPELLEEPVVGQIYDGKVNNIQNFGAFIVVSFLSFSLIYKFMTDIYSFCLVGWFQAQN